MYQPEIFGIDLGTTNSCIAYVDEHGTAVVIPNSEGDQTTPSVVLFDGTQRIIGKEARAYELLRHEQVVKEVKQKMGKPGAAYKYGGIEYTPEEISSYILRKLVDDAKLYLNCPVNDVIITCPYYFGIAQREATVKAGQLAGLNVHEVINEPTAAAFLYGLSQQEDQVAIVYDLGGGTFDVTVIEMKNGVIEVIATGGDNELGGLQWDLEFMQYLDEQWMLQTNSNDSPSSSDEYFSEFQRKAEEAKKSLSVRQQTLVTLDYAGQRVGIEVTRATFEKKTARLLKKTIRITKSTMDAASAKGVSSFHQIILVGGSTRMPQVKELLDATFHISVRVFDPDLAVAKGAALYGHKFLADKEMKQRAVQQTVIAEDVGGAEKISDCTQTPIVQQAVASNSWDAVASERLTEMSIINVASHSFGIVVADIRRGIQIISNVVMMNDPLPVIKTRIYRTAEEDQENVEFQIMENNVNGSRVEDLSLGEDVGHVLLHLPAGLPQYSPIEVTLTLQHDGRLRVAGREPVSNTVIEAEVETAQGMSKSEFRHALTRASHITVS